ncbi:MAG: hypothetical protein NT001_00660 [Candidatus Woesearchaeota archaeon]|nr:hypothetical protein [Candidatus Woesearchaeota archaeon]
MDKAISSQTAVFSTTKYINTPETLFLMKEDKHAKIMQIIRIRGPVMPSQINKEINVDVLTGSAILSELVDNGKLKISSIKVGNSPLYYAPGQESMLQKYADNLNGKDKEVFDMLKQRKVLRDKALDTLPRVSLRQMKDFAKPINVRINNEDVLFWKWYLISNEEAAQILKGMIPQNQINVPQKEVKQEAIVQRLQPQQITGKRQEEKELRYETIEKPKTEERKEKQERLEVAQKKPAELRKSEKTEQGPVKLPKEEPKDKFFRSIKDYFDSNKIEMVDFKVIRKESDLEFVIRIPSSVGSLMYFCKAKNKKRFTEGDLSSVFLEGQRKNMPILFLVTGELTKKANDMLGAEFKNMSVKRI